MLMAALTLMSANARRPKDETGGGGGGGHGLLDGIACSREVALIDPDRAERRSLHAVRLAGLSDGMVLVGKL